ncbi:MAG: hypothetical protein H0U86_15230 [Chloroflexi bacterium]|nr:hypothetical protein [Chloroflexota bacterium]
MTRDDDFIGHLEGYLDEYEGSTPLPNEVRDAIRSRLTSTQQRPAWWPARRFPEMNNSAKLALGAAAVVVAAFLGIRFLLPGGVGLGGPGPTPTPTPTPVPVLDGQSNLGGRYRVDTNLPVDVTVALPAGEGWSAGSNWVAIGPKGNDAPDGMAIRFYTAGDQFNLFNEPLSASDGVLDPPVGPTVDDLVQAIVSHPAWTATEPTDISVDGYAGQLVQLTIPLDADLSPTGNDRFLLFDDGLGGQVWGWQPGQTHAIHIVDIDGERVIIEAFSYPGTSAEDLAAQQAVVDSVQFEPQS